MNTEHWRISAQPMEAGEFWALLVTRNPNDKAQRSIIRVDVPQNCCKRDLVSAFRLLADRIDKEMS